MELSEYIKEPKLLDRDSLYELRSALALYPYFQNVRLLLLQNLYLLHDPSFDEELRRAAIYITDRKVLFQMIEAAHYRMARPERNEVKGAVGTDQDSRTLSLIDDFLDSIPKDEEIKGPAKKRKPTPADAAVDYVAYLLESQSDDEIEEAPQLKGQQLIDTFIEQDKGKIVLSENPLLKPEDEQLAPEQEKQHDESVYTETLARIYIKQGNYLRALQIIKQLSLDNPKKNVYFADQIRFLEKLIINNKQNIR